MSKKCLSIMFFLICVSSWCNLAFGEIVCPERDPNSAWWLSMDEWKSTAKNGLWADPLNWSAQRPINSNPPDCNTWACVSPNPPGAAILTDAACYRLSIEAWSWDYAGTANLTDVNVRGGTFDAGCALDLASKGGFVYAPADRVQGNATFNVYAGTVITPVPLNWGVDSGSTVDINGLMVGGSTSMVNVYNTAVANIYGGLVSVPRIAIYNGQINLRGGILEGLTPPHTDTVGRDRNDFYISDLMQTNRINIAGGTLILAGDWTNDVTEYNSVGKIIVYDFRGEASWNYNITNVGKTTVVGIPNFGPAWNPVPLNGAGEINSTPVLRWTPGDYDYNSTIDPIDPNDPNGWKHHLYFGTSYNEVSEANESNTVYVGEFIDQNAYDVCSWNGDLTFNITYYWRVDEFNDANVNSPWKGQIWSFTTMTGIASNPYPDMNNTTGFDVNRLYLGWTPGLWASEEDGNGHNVYFGTSFNDVNTATTATITPLRIYKGKRYTSRFYLDDTVNLPAGTFVEGRNYYWRVDEFNSAHAPEKSWKGKVWKFTFPLTFMVEDFNSYDTSTDSFHSVWDVNYFTEGSGYCAGVPGGYDSTGATVTWDPTNKYMTYDYNNNSANYNMFSEVRMEGNNTGVDWKCTSVPDTQDPNILIISYLGLNYNGADPVYDRMYVAVRDAAGTMGPVVYNPDVAAQRQTSWTDWMIRFSDLKGATALDFTHEVNLIIGFGQRCNPKKDAEGIPGGTGTVIFDNIRVSKSFCNPLLGQPSADFSGDCKVDINDLDIFLYDWKVESEVNNFPSASEPLPGPILWYQFEETTGRIAVNSGSAGNTYDANVEANYVSPWDAGGRIGRCINLPYGSNSFVNVPPAIWSAYGYTGTTGTAFTLMAWIAVDTNWSFTNWNGLFDVAAGSTELIENECPTPWPPPSQSAGGPKARFRVGTQVDVTPPYTQRLGDFSKRWNHYAFVVDADNDVAKIYENGSLIAATITAPGSITPPLLSSEPTWFIVGGRFGSNWGMWYGKIDDVRMYNRALDADQIAWIATNGTKTITIPLVERSNFKTGDATEVINFRDFAVLADQWLDAPVLMQ